jgi:hypothetical protein
LHILVFNDGLPKVSHLLNKTGGGSAMLDCSPSQADAANASGIGCGFPLGLYLPVFLKFSKADLRVEHSISQ